MRDVRPMRSDGWNDIEGDGWDDIEGDGYAVEGDSIY